MKSLGNLGVSAARIEDDIAALAAITDPDRPYTRRAFTPRHAEGRDYLRRRFEAAGLATTIDASGNLIGRRPGASPGRGTIMLGSHSDTVPDGGRFDGIAGVIAALEVARALHDGGIALDHDLEVVDFLAEEVSIFGVSCVGSRGMAGVRPPEWLSRRQGDQTLEQGIAEAGGDPHQVARREDVAAFLELHIEQGTVLEAAGLDIGVVTAITGIARIEIVLEGRADHAGTTPMGRRRDALVAAARLVTAIEAEATRLAAGPRYFAATVGEFEMLPNAANVVPSHVRLLIDARSQDAGDLADFSAAIEAHADALAEATQVSIASRRISDAGAVPMDAGVVSALDDAVGAIGATGCRLASGAGHDAAFLARISRAGMVFVPCRDGRSHAPEEWAETDAIALGAAVLLKTVQTLDTQGKGQADGSHSG
ncbi:Zn-dependent hydrolase [Aureimonas flava]|uniref:Zn-dependent hydrolase n=1 Tax=Aureimonas flava TaxID=2320271 RepID=A0A3A1WQ76_9HYPH|nr:Zn-dependent hydrolase [Aureimonas flava]RIX99691.1 Zn-dependent hydrolase [Aureimonas flava]